MSALPFTLRQLQYVLAIHETRSFRRAAERCAVAQPSLSAQVAALESALDIRFFERDRRGVLPTPAGEALLGRIRRVLMEAGELVEDARHFQDPLSGSLRLGVIPTMAPYLLPAAVPRLREAFPRLTPRWVEDRTASLVANLQQGLLDGALLALEADLENLDVLPLAKDPFVLAVPPGHRLAKGTRKIRLEDLDGESFLLLDDGHCLRDQALEACRDTRMQELGFRATSLPTLVQMVAGGMGITLLPEMAVSTELGRTPLVIRRFAEPEPSRTLGLVWRKGSHAAEALMRLAEVLRNIEG